ncbi:rho guanine nucleotide exchange factor 3-like [Petromyzon marinus]|uniref:Rho guanine nucleotide exchange factor 3-like n=1 Tax=Petromyzon marinus TaxID=7757 RepID=A0AAJ7T2L9_PETMA|nr:rho guanine nucleotide exchange factor 3-like [Petromyzon marinus]
MVAKDCPHYTGGKRGIGLLEREHSCPLRETPEEPSHKRVRSKSSLVNLIFPVKTAAAKHFGRSLQRTTSVRSVEQPPAQQKTPPGKSPPAPVTPPQAGPPPRRSNSRLWSETFTVRDGDALPSSEIKRQETIFELFQGEQALIEDLQLAKKAYHDPMLKLGIMNEEELTKIFGDLDSFIPLHQDLVRRLEEARGPDGTVKEVGQTLVTWLPCLNAYTSYCGNQVAAKALLDQKKRDPRVQDFLQRCIESPFSRKLELWSFLDVPRSRLVKYPLLLREIERHTPAEHPDVDLLRHATEIVRGILSEINLRTGESECCFYRERLEFVDARHRDPRIASARLLHCHGELRNQRGTKLHVFLFDEVLVLTRPGARGERSFYQVFRQPVPTAELRLEDITEPGGRGSFRGPFGPNDRGKNAFRVGVGPMGRGHTLQADSAYNKRRWLACLGTALHGHTQGKGPPPSPPEIPADDSGPPTPGEAYSDAEEAPGSVRSDMELSLGGFSDSESERSEVSSVMDTSEVLHMTSWRGREGPGFLDEMSRDCLSDHEEVSSGQED